LLSTRRTRSKNRDEAQRIQGIAKPAIPKPPAARPKLTPVGDCFFIPEPFCRKVKMTVRFLTVENMSGPYRTYNMFPVADRLAILRKFLMRYTWGPGDDVSRCLDVYENLAANMYGNELS
jgi:hypothetical protein